MYVYMYVFVYVRGRLVVKCALPFSYVCMYVFVYVRVHLVVKCALLFVMCLYVCICIHIPHTKTSVKVGVLTWLFSNASYRRYICKSNKDAPSASRLSPGRAGMYKTRRVFLRSGDVYKAKVLGNLQNADSLYIEASIIASECSK
jgi:hypothetical protein